VLLDQARNGAQVEHGEDEDAEVIPAAVFRAALLRAHRLHAARESTGIAQPMSEEAEAGGIIEAETAVEIHDIRGMIKGYLEALRDQSGG
jgi:hypothetical protein